MSTEKIVSPLQESDLFKKSLCDYVVNIASGCRHKCAFCYVPSTPAIRARANELKNNGVEDPQLDWGDYLFIREDVPQKLEETLERKRSWNSSPSGKGVVLLCSGTDPYQNPQTAAITRESVKALLKYGKRVRILTRSPLWTRDLDILVNPNVTVGMSIPHLDDELSRQIEINAPRPSDRLAALRQGREAGCRLFVAMAPTVPMHGIEDFHRFFGAVLDIQPEVIFWEPINARGSNSTRMRALGLDWVDEISEGHQWAQNFLTQWQALYAAAEQADSLHLIHPWFDKKLKHYIPEEEWWMQWFDRPTIESWEEEVQWKRRKRMKHIVTESEEGQDAVLGGTPPVLPRDAVLGGTPPVLPRDAVLGGVEGAKRLLPTQPRQAIDQLFKYGEAGWEVAFQYLRQHENALILLEHYHYLLNDLFLTPQDLIDLMDSFLHKTGHSAEVLVGWLKKFSTHPLIMEALEQLICHAERNGVFVPSPPAFMTAINWEVPVCDREFLLWEERALLIRIAKASSSPYQIHLGDTYTGHVVRQETGGMQWTTIDSPLIRRDFFSAGIQVIKYALHLQHPELPLSPTLKPSIQLFSEY